MFKIVFVTLFWVCLMFRKEKQGIHKRTSPDWAISRKFSTT